MSDDDLFQAEARFLRQSRARLAEIKSDFDAQDDESTRQVALTAIEHLERLLTMSRRLVRHADRSEARLRETNQRLLELSAKLEFQSRHDGLTGLFNRVAFLECAEAALERGACALILLDIDFFKNVNDRYGHPVGDAVLRAFAQTLRDWVRGWQSGGEMSRNNDPMPVFESSAGKPPPDTSEAVAEADPPLNGLIATDDAGLPASVSGPSDIRHQGLEVALGRLGGEEFGIILGPITQPQAYAAVDRLLEGVRAIRIAEEPGLRITTSAGALWSNEPGLDFDMAYVCGDDALYRAKMGGRNRVEWVDDCGGLALKS
ncbi:MAG: GGDEF domain-containing protein [Thioalkalivibrionaceae bacterium]